MRRVHRSRPTEAERLDRSARRWLRAYPPRWRRERADEAAALLVDLAAPGSRRLDVRTVAGLVAAGWRTRLRTRPPARVVLAYRLAGRRPPTAYDGWLRDDVEGLLYPLRAEGSTLVVGIPTSVAVMTLLSATGWPSRDAVVGGTVFLVGWFTWLVVQQYRRRAQHLADLFGPPVRDEIGHFGPYVGLDAPPARDAEGTARRRWTAPRDGRGDR